MKAAILLLAFYAQADRLIDVPATPVPSFPMRLHVIVERAGLDNFHGRLHFVESWWPYLPDYRSSGTMHGYGTANLTGDPAGDKGVEFAFDCHNAFAASGKQDLSYPARWTRPGKELEIRTQRPGASHTDTCTVAVQVKPRNFNLATRSTWHSALLGASTNWRDPDVAYAGDAPDYPVHLRVLESRFRATAGSVYGYGTANLLDAAGQGVTFTYNCDHGVTANSQPGEFYLAHWVRQDQKLELLQQRIGSDHLDHCRIDLTLQPTAFPDPS